MATNTRFDPFYNVGQGIGFATSTVIGVQSGSSTAATSSCGFNTIQIAANSIGTTFPSTIQGIVLPPQLPNRALLTLSMANITQNRGISFAYFYRIGTQVLTSTGDQFTHDAATFPILRTQFGVASQAITLMPIVHVTTALATTSAQLVLETAASGNGYTDQNGNSTRGTKTFIFPSATTAVHSCYNLQLNDDDSGVQDINAIRTTVAASAGAATIWGVELISNVTTHNASTHGVNSAMFGGFNMIDLKPGVATSGTATSFLGLLICGSASAASSGSVYIQGALP